MLLFAGRGSAFAESHNSAFFIDKNTLILLDCPMSAFQKYRYLDFNQIQRIFILVTHTHGDHAGGIGSMIHFTQFVLNKNRNISLTVAAPSDRVKKDLTMLLRIEGCDKTAYSLITADQIGESWFRQAVPTDHADLLKGKCFGYCLYLNGRTIVYTGDTKILEPFLPYLRPGDFLYTEASVLDKTVHLYLPDYLPVLQQLTEQGIHVFLMHLDDEREILKQIQGTKIQLAPLYHFRKEIPVRLVRTKISEIAEIKALYELSFPDNEKAPFPLLFAKQYFADVDFLTIYAGKQFAGFFYLVNFEHLSYIFYFAIRPDLRNKGIGSRALQRLQKFCYGRKLFLAIEQPAPDENHYQERIDRKYFYLKNQFRDLHKRVQEGSVIYELLSTGGDVSPQEYHDLIQSFTGKFLYRNIPMKILED